MRGGYTLNPIEAYLAAERIAPGNEIKINIVKQSKEIANGVDNGGAGDQGIMVGYACNENEAKIPHELFLARDLCKTIYKKFEFDGKTQITIDETFKILAVVASFQNTKNVELDAIVREWLEDHEHYQAVSVYINPAGEWRRGGFEADTGLTGRKLAVDNYGPRVPIGGGAFSGKDPSKVDRSAAYKARHLAVSILAEEKNALDCTVKLAYSIGIPTPVMATAFLNMADGTTKEVEIDSDSPSLTPRGIRGSLDLHRPTYEETAKWGAFGNGFLWDK